MKEAPNYTKEAFLETGNLVFLLLVAVASTAAVLLPMAPSWLGGGLLMVGAGTELIYLGIRSGRPSLRRTVERQEGPTPSEVYRRLSRHSQRRYYRLRQFRDDIRANYQQLSAASQGLLDMHLKKLDGLLQSYLDLLYQRERYYGLTSRDTEAEVRRAIRELEDEESTEAERVQAVKQRRLSVLRKRLERLRAAREDLAVIGAQLGAIEDVVKYIHEQSWTLQNPEEVTVQLDTLLDEVEETQRSVHEIESVFSQTPTSSDDLSALDEELAAALDEGADRFEDGVPSSVEARQSQVRDTESAERRRSE